VTTEELATTARLAPGGRVDSDVDGAPANPARAAAWLFALGITCVALVVGGYLVCVRTAWGQRIDNAAWAGRRFASGRAIDASGHVLRTISTSSLAIAVVVLALTALVRGRPRLAVVVGLAILGACVTTEVLKLGVLTRPELIDNARIAKNTYPSGHSTVAMSVAVAAVLVVPQRWRGGVALVGLGYASLVGIATVTAGWHRPSDVGAGFAVAFGWGAAAALVLVGWRGTGVTTPRVRHRPPPRIALLLAVIGGGLVLGLTAIAAAVLTASGHDLFAVHRSDAFPAAVLGIAAVAALLGAALLGALRGVTLDPVLE
jgi:membrane-associated phospholipid phosphatase